MSDVAKCCAEACASRISATIASPRPTLPPFSSSFWPRAINARRCAGDLRLPRHRPRQLIPAPSAVRPEPDTIRSAARVAFSIRLPSMSFRSSTSTATVNPIVNLDVPTDGLRLPVCAPACARLLRQLRERVSVGSAARGGGVNAQVRGRRWPHLAGDCFYIVGEPGTDCRLSIGYVSGSAVSGVFRPCAISAARCLACRSVASCASSSSLTSATSGAISAGPASVKRFERPSLTAAIADRMLASGFKPGSDLHPACDEQQRYEQCQPREKVTSEPRLELVGVSLIDSDADPCRMFSGSASPARCAVHAGSPCAGRAPSQRCVCVVPARQDIVGQGQPRVPQRDGAQKVAVSSRRKTCQYSPPKGRRSAHRLGSRASVSRTIRCRRADCRPVWRCADQAPARRAARHGGRTE